MIWYKCICGVLMNADLSDTEKECPLCKRVAEITICEPTKYFPAGNLWIRIIGNQ